MAILERSIALPSGFLCTSALIEKQGLNIFVILFMCMYALLSHIFSDIHVCDFGSLDLDQYIPTENALP